MQVLCHSKAPGERQVRACMNYKALKNPHSRLPAGRLRFNCKWMVGGLPLQESPDVARRPIPCIRKKLQRVKNSLQFN
jgi:hypothetical protein